ncbi:MAG: hypothetical protein LBU19_03210, partial [Treponema sp.]|nr:hypothetical protein [Treponema sp.]
DFGFDDEDAGESRFAGQSLGFGLGGGSPLAVSIGGEVQASMIGFFDDFADGAGHTRFGNIFSGKLNFAADTSAATAVINLKLRPTESPVTIDEAYVSAYFGSLDIEAGLRKLTWGKADSSGPLDVINPVDYSDLSGLGDSGSLKIARPLIRASFHFGQFNKLEGVFVPNFEPVKFAGTGRWAPAQFAALSQFPSENIIKPDTTTLDYAQAGLRFTTTIRNAADLGVQYYYGRMTSPVVTQTPSVDPNFPIVTFAYNPYHQIGLDYAQVIAGFNLRAEMAANITEDFEGNDGAVYNPSFAWSLGFDREVFWGITLNVQCNETIRLLDGKIKDPQDIEADSDITSTSLTAALAKSFLRDELELEAAALWDIENGACLLMPGLTWTKDDVAVELLAGIFAGNNEGLFGQFHDNSFIKASIKYTF